MSGASYSEGDGRGLGRPFAGADGAAGTPSPRAQPEPHTDGTETPAARSHPPAQHEARQAHCAAWGRTVHGGARLAVTLEEAQMPRHGAPACRTLGRDPRTRAELQPNRGWSGRGSCPRPAHGKRASELPRPAPRCASDPGACAPTRVTAGTGREGASGRSPGWCSRAEPAAELRAEPNPVLPRPGHASALGVFPLHRGRVRFALTRGARGLVLGDEFPSRRLASGSGGPFSVCPGLGSRSFRVAAELRRH